MESKLAFSANPADGRRRQKLHRERGLPYLSHESLSSWRFPAPDKQSLSLWLQLCHSPKPLPLPAPSVAPCNHWRMTQTENQHLGNSANRRLVTAWIWLKGKEHTVLLQENVNIPSTFNLPKLDLIPPNGGSSITSAVSNKIHGSTRPVRETPRAQATSVLQTSSPSELLTCLCSQAWSYLLESLLSNH